MGLRRRTCTSAGCLISWLRLTLNFVPQEYILAGQHRTGHRAAVSVWNVGYQRACHLEQAPALKPAAGTRVTPEAGGLALFPVSATSAEQLHHGRPAADWADQNGAGSRASMRGLAIVALPPCTDPSGRL